MRRIVLTFIAALVALLGLMPLASATQAVPSMEAADYTYDTSASASPGNGATSERGPPAHGLTTTACDVVVDRWSHGMLALPAELTALLSSTYAHPTMLGQVVQPAPATARQAVVAGGELSSAQPVRDAAKTGPGAWGTAAESMSSRAAAYQARVTGGAASSVYRVGGVKFDGFANGFLQEAKGPGYAKFVRNGQFQPWFSGADARLRLLPQPIPLGDLMKLVDASEPWADLPELGPDDIVVAVSRDELVGLANVIGEALQAVDDWEFDTRVGLLPQDARTLRDQISEVLRSTARPE